VGAALKVSSAVNGALAPTPPPPPTPAPPPPPAPPCAYSSGGCH
jgi:hypothetical protein